MVSGLIVESTVTKQCDWEVLAQELFSQGAVGVMEAREGDFTIYAKVTGFVHDPTYGRLIQVERIRGSEESTGSKKGVPVEKGA